MRKLRIWLIFSMFALPTSYSEASWADKTPYRTGDEVQVAAEISQKLVENVMGEDCPPQCRVAVFAFGDSQGNISGELVQSAEILQGEIIQQLSKLAAGRIHVLDKAGLAREFQRAGIDASAVSPKDAEATAKVLQQIGVDVAVVGTMTASKTESGLIDLQVYAVKRTGRTFGQHFCAGSVQMHASPAPPPSLDSQFNVEVLMDGLPQKLQRSTNPDSGYFKALFLVLPRSVIGREYQLRLTNRGKVPQMNDNTGVPPVVGAVVTVDGVNSIYQQNANGQTGPVILHPKNCLKWILSNPGNAITPDSASPSGYRLSPAPGQGQSVLTIPGFQSGPEISKAFTFATVRDSVAENIGITNEIGLISVHFYPEDRQVNPAGVPVTEKSLGASRPGRDILNPVYKVNVQLEDNPAEVWRIFYRYEDDPSLNQLALRPITD